MRNPLKTKCRSCGKFGTGLSVCKHCGEFITMTLHMDIKVRPSKHKPRTPKPKGAS